MDKYAYIICAKVIRCSAVLVYEKFARVGFHLAGQITLAIITSETGLGMLI